MKAMTIEERLFTTPFKVDQGKPHLVVKNPETCINCQDKQCSLLCPAKCYSIDDKGRAHVAWEGCVECGTCRIVCNEFHNVSWEYPRGGFGVNYNQG